MRVWSIANQKGGVGKTTTVVTLAGLLSSQGKNTLMVDMDPHGSLTSYFGLDPETVEHSVYTLFQQSADGIHAPLASLLVRTPFDRLHLLPASTAMAALDRQLGARDGMGLVLSNTLQRLGRQFDHVLIDSPPLLGILMVNALAACERVIVPVQTEYLALRGLERFIETLRRVERSRRFPFRPLLVPTMFDRRTRASTFSLQWLVEHYPELLWDGIVPVDTGFREASRAGKPWSLMNPTAKGVTAYRSLTQELLNVPLMKAA
jgi:chromosome partitioning protein